MEPTKICTKCNIPKVEEEFRDRKRGKRHSRCKECAAKYIKEYLDGVPGLKAATSKKSYEKHKQKRLGEKKTYYSEHAEEVKTRRKQYYEENREVILEKAKVYASENRGVVREKTKVYRQSLKMAALMAYGGVQCVCKCGCKEKHPLCLTIDHDGCTKEQRKREGLGTAFYLWLKQHRYPIGYQVLCFNCNMGRALNGGQCPHLQEKSPGIDEAGVLCQSVG